jgi:cell division protein FtsQ
MGRKQVSESESKGRGWCTQIRYSLVPAAVVVSALFGIFLYYRLEQFLAIDPRFRLTGPSEQAEEHSSLQTEGIVYASRDKVVNVFAADFGRSLYLLPLRERRRSLLAMDWIKDASISRLWPNRLAVRIVERMPVAFIRLPAPESANSFHVAMIDGDGVILEQPPRARFAVPVLTGIRSEQSRQMRHRRVRQALRLVKEAGELADDISEIDVSDPENLKITRQLDDRAVVLMLGNRHFRSRLQNFLNHYPEIRQRLAHATTFDLRLDDRITAVREVGRGG